MVVERPLLLLGAIAALVVGACALEPGARVGGASTAGAERPITARVSPGMTERIEPARRSAPVEEAPIAVATAATLEAEDDLEDDAHVHHEVDAKPASASRARRETRTTRTSSKKSPSKSVRPTEARAEAPSREPAVEPAASVTPPPGLALDPRALSPRECKALLDAHGVRYEVTEGASDEHLYVRPKGPIGGVDYVFEGRRTVHEVMDCRLVVALLKLSPVLKREGVRRIRHLSVFRPDARVAQTGKRSGHASALAIDVRFLEFEDGRTLDVLADWGNRERGVMPCAEGVGASDPNPELRRITCEMIDAQIFQTVITPHRDQLHENHVHLELVPEVEWTYVR